jgi:hyperosmotically inducible periplasmic protein
MGTLQQRVLALTLGLAACTLAQAQSAPDNTRMNKDPANSTAMSSVADGQSNSAADLALTKKIRQSVMADKSLSTYAHNVKIVSVNGAVTLNGVVRSENEKSRVMAKAVRVAGKGSVTSDLTVQAE